ncbi:ATP-binding protein [Pectobacterium actinidiae]|uniref:ATP-binding protein n=1 Tax=Pectobacterium actinidiae TaxID=1507808 RepID=UPI0038130B15
MKSLNILSLVQAHESLNREGFDLFMQHYGIEIKHAELQELQKLSESLRAITNNIYIFSGFYVGYKIPQIGKEFDLLRITKNCVINIELKRTSSEDKIRKQLIRNKYYLSFIGERIYNLSYISDIDKLYILDADDSLRLVEFNNLVNLLINYKLDFKEHIDTLFNPSDYLVSPFNSTQKFLRNQYFLTHQQEDVKNKILSSLFFAVAANFIAVVGGAGTGKTLLVYDIVKILMREGKKALIIHCGYLNEGQEELKSCGWKIIQIKNFSSYELSNYDIVIIDEAQRVYPEQLEKIVSSITTNKGDCIFSYDKMQTLAKWEEARDIDGKINKISKISTYKLSEKIRSNKEIANFIKMLFNNRRSLELSNTGNIEINYFKNIDDARCYLELLDNKEWEVLRFTPSQYKNEHHEKYSDLSKKTSHRVIGQEFDNVAVTIDEYFKYDAEGILVYRGSAYYYPLKMLFQNITRARKRLNIVIINNEELLNRCMAILQ